LKFVVTLRFLAVHFRNGELHFHQKKKARRSSDAFILAFLVEIDRADGL